MEAQPFSRFTVKALMGFAVCSAALLHDQTAAATPAVVGLWRFDEGSGTNISDSSGLGNDGTLEGDNGNLPTWTNGQPGFGSALLFTNDNVNHTYVNIPGSPSLMIGQTATNAWTITAWAYEMALDATNFIATYGRVMVIDGGDAFQLESGATNDDEFYTWSRDNLYATPWQIGWGSGSPVSPLLDQWEHLAVVYDGTNITFYLNGDQAPNGGIASRPATLALQFVASQGSILIGSELVQPANRNWSGMLDDVAVFNGALTMAQISNVMAGDFSAFLGGPAGIVSQPQSQLALAGSQATLSVGAYGAQPLTYQWYLNGTNLGAIGTDAILTINDIALSQAGSYSVVVSNALATVTSQPTALSVGSLVALWRFNEGSGTTAYDSSGLGNNGTLIGQNGNVPTWVTGQPGFGGALRFTNDGNNYAYVAVPGSPLLEIGQNTNNAWTITAWAYEDSDGTGSFISYYGRIIVIDDGAAFEFESGAVGDAEFYTWDEDPYNPAWQLGWGAFVAGEPLLDQWEHLAVVYDGTNLTLYLNGNQGPNSGVGSQPVTSALEYGSLDQGAVIIGSELDTGTNCNWNGMLDDVAIFNFALSQAQVQAVMAGNFNGFVSQPPLSVGLKADNVLVSWPATAQTFALQATTNLSSTGWSSVTNMPSRIGNTMTVTLPGSLATEYFRLVGP